MLLATSATDESHCWLCVGLLDAESGCAMSCLSSFGCPQFVCLTPRTPQLFPKCTLIRSRRQVPDGAGRSQVFMTNELGTNEFGIDTSDDDSTQKFCRNGRLHLPSRTHCRNLTAALRFIRQRSSGKIVTRRIAESQIAMNRKCEQSVQPERRWFCF